MLSETLQPDIEGLSVMYPYHDSQSTDPKIELMIPS